MDRRPANFGSPPDLPRNGLPRSLQPSPSCSPAEIAPGELLKRLLSSFVCRQSMLILIAGAIAISLVVPNLAVASGQETVDENSAARLVQRTADQVIEIVKTKTGAVREAGITQLLESDFDLNYMGRLSLGTHWNTATPQQRERFLKATASAEAHAYAQRFGQYLGQTLTVGRVISRPNGSLIVESKLNQTDGDPVAIQWEVRKVGQGARIVDVKTEGVSMVMTRRADYNSYIQSHGGQLQPLIDELETRAKR